MILSRRDWFAASAVAVWPSRLPAAPKPAVVDTHTHFYDPTRPGGVPWPGKDDKALYRPVLPAEYRKLAAPLGITGTVVVEASPRVEDNRWLLDLAAREPFLLGVVGNLDPADADFAKNLDRFAKDPLFRGIRIARAALKKAIADADVLKNLARLADADRALDANGGPEMLPDVAALAEKLPKLRIVVNHMANPFIDGKAPADGYAKNLRAAAKPNVWCKLSALVDGTRARGAAPKDLAFYRPTADAVWNAFGADRLVFGSNWPVSDLYAPFGTVVALAKEYLTEKGAAEKVFGANAVAAYKLTC